MNIHRLVVVVTSSVCASVVASSLAIVSLAQSNSTADGSDPKVTETSTRPLPLRLPGNKDLPRNVFRTQESFVKELRPGAVLASFELITYGEYLKKYANGITGPTDVSPDRMVAVIVADFPKGLKTERGDHYSSARSVSARDALTGQTISFELSGKSTTPSGPSLIFPNEPYRGNEDLPDLVQP
ncbi:hypothetical protein ACN4EG_23845 [Alkalinema pantanalense CENA528]|uniref:hypothetical protein n=1 Tax=Alkalinema pantanalense TaxID=1620705 RepID=UPI003D6F8534